jgi:hypothetical protein
LKNAETSQIFAATFFCGESCVLIVAKNGLGYALGDFFPRLACPRCQRAHAKQAKLKIKEAIIERLTRSGTSGS